MLKNGERAPEFTLPDQDGRERSLSQLLGGEALILYFYPADFTPGCTREACDLRDLHAQILAVGLRVAGVSPQSPDSHKRFRDQYSLPFTLLSDEEKSVIRAFGVDGVGEESHRDRSRHRATAGIAFAYEQHANQMLLPTHR